MFMRTVFYSSKQKTQKASLASGCCLDSHCSPCFQISLSKNNKKLFPLFFLLFREQRKNGISPCFQFGVLRVVPVIFPPTRLLRVSLPARYQGAIRSFFSIKSLSWTQIPGAIRHLQLRSCLIYHEISVGLLVFKHASSWLLCLVFEKIWIFFLGVYKIQGFFFLHKGSDSQVLGSSGSKNKVPEKEKKPERGKKFLIFILENTERL